MMILMGHDGSEDGVWRMWGIAGLHVQVARKAAWLLLKISWRQAGGSLK